MRLKKIFAVLSVALLLGGVLQSDAFAEKASIGQFTPPTAMAMQEKPSDSPASTASYYSGSAPAANTVKSAKPGITIGNTYYKSLQDAVDSVKNGQTIHVTKNVALSKAVGCNRKINFTIDFHNHKLKMPEEDNALYIKKGSISLKGMQLTGFSTYKSIDVCRGASVVIVSGKYSGQINVDGALTIKGGMLVGDTSNHSTIFNHSAGHVNIQGGTVQTQGTSSVVLWNDGTMKITNGTIATVRKDGDRKNSPTIWNDGKLFVSGGIIKGTYAANAILNLEIGGDNTVAQCFISGGDIKGSIFTMYGAKTTISGGTIKEDSFTTIGCFDGNVKITGGSIINRKDICALVEKGTVDIRGGNFKGNQKKGGFVAVCRVGILNISGGSFIGSDPWVFEYNGDAINLSNSVSRRLAVYIPKK